MSDSDQPDVRRSDDLVSAASAVVTRDGITFMTTREAAADPAVVKVPTQVNIATMPSFAEPTLSSVRSFLKGNLRDVEFQIARIRELSTRTPPAEDALEELRGIRYWADLRRRHRASWFRQLLSLGRVVSSTAWALDFNAGHESIDHELSAIETTLLTHGLEEQSWKALADLRRLDDATQIRVRRLQSTF